MCYDHLKQNQDSLSCSYDTEHWQLLEKPGQNNSAMTTQKQRPHKHTSASDTKPKSKPKLNETKTPIQSFKVARLHPWARSQQSSPSSFQAQQQHPARGNM